MKFKTSGIYQKKKKKQNLQQYGTISDKEFELNKFPIPTYTERSTYKIPQKNYSIIDLFYFDFFFTFDVVFIEYLSIQKLSNRFS